MEAIIARRASLPQTESSFADIFRGIEVKRYLDASDNAWEFLGANFPVLCLPAPIVYLMGQGAWHYILHVASWNEKFKVSFPLGASLREHMQWPSRDWLEHIAKSGLFGHRPRRRRPGRDLFTPVHAEELAKRLREWSPLLLNQVALEERSDLKHELEDFIGRLDESFHHEAGIQDKKQDGHASARKLLSVFLASSQLRNRGNLKSVTYHTLQAVELDRATAANLVSRLVGTDAGTLSRKQISIDAALCLSVQERIHGQEGPLYVWADSSPKAGTDWLLSTLLWIEKASLNLYFMKTRSKMTIDFRLILKTILMLSCFPLAIT